MWLGSLSLGMAVHIAVERRVGSDTGVRNLGLGPVQGLQVDLGRWRKGGEGRMILGLRFSRETGSILFATWRLEMSGNIDSGCLGSCSDK